ncbi:MAG: TMAO reductase system periplasmic protein TorT [Gammaproteobacteria bacterium]|nr:TMAO reductase system periplasmic protein TorT [Gammaproteobacteria bacterium]
MTVLNSRSCLRLLVALFIILQAVAATTARSEVWRLETWSTPFDYSSDSRIIDYQPTSKASREWHLCISYPHLKDAYWLNVNYGMVQEARRLGIAFTLVEAGGYPNVERQRQQIEQCTSEGADALIVGTVSFRGLHQSIVRIANTLPVFSTVNDIEDTGITAKSGVSWTTMGRVAGEYLAQRHKTGSKPVTVAWFPGPQGAGWVDFIEAGFKQGLKDSAIEIVVTKWGDTGKEIQRTLVQEVLESHPKVDYIVGNALMAEAAISTLRNRKLENKIKIVSTYFTPAVYRGIRRGRILAAPTDSPVMQGRISIDQAIGSLEGRDIVKHAGPQIQMIDQFNWQEIDISDSLAPPTFLPTFIWP